MPNVLYSGHGTVSQPAGQSVFYPFGMGCGSGSGTLSTEQEVTLRTAGTWTNMYMNLRVNGVTNTSTAQLILGAGAKNNTLSIPGNTTGEFQDLVDADASTVGQSACCLKLITGAGGSLMAPISWGILYNASGSVNTLTRPTQTGGYTLVGTANSTIFLLLTGGNGAGTTTNTEAQSQFTVHLGGTMANLVMRVANNSRTDTVTAGNRINGANGSLVVSVATLTTGIFEDTTDVDTIHPGDLLNMYLKTGADNTNSILMTVLGMEFKNDNTASFNTAGLINGLTVTAPGAVTYLSVQGDLRADATEANNQIRSMVLTIASNLGVNVIANTTAAASILTLRNTGVDGALTISISAGLTGYFENLTDKMYLSPNDLINYSFAIGGSSGSLEIELIGHQIKYTGKSVVIQALRPRIPAPGLAR